MRKFLAFILAVGMLLSLCACAKSESTVPDSDEIAMVQKEPPANIPQLPALHLTAQDVESVVYDRDGLEITLTGGEVSNGHCLLYFHVKNTSGRGGADLTAVNTLLNGQSLHAGAWTNERTTSPVDDGVEGTGAVCFWGEYLEEFFNAEFGSLTTTLRVRLDGEVIAEIPLEVDGEIFAGSLKDHMQTIRYREISFQVPESWRGSLSENGSISIMRFDAAAQADYGLVQAWTIDMNSFVSWQYQMFRDNLLILRTYHDETVPEDMKLPLKDNIFGAQKNIYETLEELMKKVIAPDFELGEIERMDLGERLAIAAEFTADVSGYPYAGRLYMTADGETITAFSATQRDAINDSLNMIYDNMIETLHYDVAPIFPEGVPAE